MNQDRRGFLTTLGAAAAAVVVGGSSASALPLASPLTESARKLARIGIQLYTVREAAALDLDGTLARLAKIGYREVEFAGYYDHPTRDVRHMLEHHGLVAPSAHVALEQVEGEQAAKTFADAKTVGLEWITVASLAGTQDTTEDWKGIAARFNTVAAQVKSAGFRFAYHNHDTEFKKIGTTVPLDLLIAETEPALVSFEMDVYWVVDGGGDPLALLAKYPGRFKMFHVKDALAGPEHKMVDVGAGTIDFKTIFARAKGIEHYFVEHDEPADAFASAATSFKYLSALKF